MTRKVTEVHNKHAPLKTIQVRKNYAPWLSNDTKELSNKRNDAEQTAITTNHPDDKRLFRNMRNQVIKKLREDKRIQEELKFRAVESNTGTLWANVKSWLNWGNSGPPTQISPMVN